MSIGTKTEISASNFETDVESFRREPNLSLYCLMDSARLALTVLSLAAGLTILGVSANAIAVYHATYVPEDWFLQLWPSNLDMRPTVALVVGGVLVVVASLVSLTAGKIPTVRGNAAVKVIITLMPPAIALIAAIISMSFFYGVDASTTNDSLQSWTCRWKDVTMTIQPHFGTLCKQSKASTGLAVMLVPVEAIILGLAAYQFVLGKRSSMASDGRGRRAGSLALSGV